MAVAAWAAASQGPGPTLEKARKSFGAVTKQVKNEMFGIA